MHSFHLWSLCPYLECFAVCKTGSRHVINQFRPDCCVVWLHLPLSPAVFTFTRQELSRRTNFHRSHKYSKKENVVIMLSFSIFFN